MVWLWGPPWWPGKTEKVDRVLEIVQNVLASLGIGLADALAEEDHSATWATEGLMRRRSDDIRVLERAGDDTGSNETRDMGHVDDKVGANQVCDLAHAGIVDEDGSRQRFRRLGPLVCTSKRSPRVCRSR